MMGNEKYYLTKPSYMHLIWFEMNMNALSSLYTVLRGKSGRGTKPNGANRIQGDKF